MTTFLLVRHATGDHVGHLLPGREPGRHLGDAGRAQAARLAERLAHRPIAAVYASPLERAHDTARPLAERLGQPVRVLPAVTELDMGVWTGRAIAELDGDTTWTDFNRFRSGTPAPGGELQLEAQARAVRALVELRARHDGETVVVVSHADVIRALVCHAAGAPLDLLLRFDIAPASVTELELHAWGPRIVCVNERPAEG